MCDWGWGSWLHTVSYQRETCPVCFSFFFKFRSLKYLVPRILNQIITEKKSKGDSCKPFKYPCILYNWPDISMKLGT